MIFEQKEFENYCLGRTYQDTLDIHLVSYKTLLWGYQKIFKKPMDEWLKKQLVLDSGCAMGHVMDDLLKNGVECEGYEPSNHAIKNVLQSVKDRIHQADHDTALPEMIDNEYDIVYANSLQYSLNEDDVSRWVRETTRVCRHSMFFVGVTTQGLSRCISGSAIWKMQIIRSQQWWETLFRKSGFEEIHWLTTVMALCLKQAL